MNSKMRLVLVALVASGMSLAANAGDFYLGLGVGGSSYESSDFVDCFGSDDCDTFNDNDVAWNVFAGYSLTDAVAVEIGYQDWGKAEDDDFFGESVSAEPSMVTVMAVGTAPIGGDFAAFGKVGIAFLNIDTHTDGGGFNAESSGSSNSQDLALGGGVQWNLGHFGIRGEVLWVDAEDADTAMMYGVSGLYKFGG
jgi:OOP family OmpA-OmpF porin